MNKVNDISKINENLVSLFYAKFENTFHAADSRMMKSLFHPITENAIHPKNHPYHYSASSIKRNLTPSSRQDYCKSVALCHLLIATDNIR
jgi:hypothetical protein